MTVVKIPDLSEMESVIRVNEIDADKVKIGQKTTLRLDAFEERLFTGEVQIVAPIADRAQSSDEDDDSQNI
jgi:multidrug efflux pump subunit AcrA (membrane-fusion protein)